MAPNIHVEVDGSYYSAPYTLAGKSLDARVTERCVELLHRGERVASHLRALTQGQYRTLAEPMPKAHQCYLDWTPERLVHWADQTGEATATVVHHLLHSRRHPQQAYNACFGLMRLGDSSSQDRLEAACRRALVIGAVGYRHIESILKHGLDQRPLPTPSEAARPLPDHGNLRGPGYYH